MPELNQSRLSLEHKQPLCQTVCVFLEAFKTPGFLAGVDRPGGRTRAEGEAFAVKLIARPFVMCGHCQWTSTLAQIIHWLPQTRDSFFSDGDWSNRDAYPGV